MIKKQVQLFKLLAAMLAAFILLSFFGIPKQSNFSELALGTQNISVFGTYKGEPIHCSTIVDIEECLDPAIERNLDQKVVWLGNSQLHAINQSKAGDKPSIQLLAERLRPEGIEVLGFSQPNASLQEHQVIFEYLLANIDFNILLLPVVFDDTRENNIRSEIATAYENDLVRENLRGTRVGARLNSSEKDVLEVKPKRLQDMAEMKLDEILSRYVKVWAARNDIRSKLSISLYYARNKALGIRATSKRKKIQSAYTNNLSAFEGIVSKAKSRGITVLAYTAPLRNDLEPPYVPGEYAQFKIDMENIAKQNGAYYLDFENIVPSSLWMRQGSEEESIDFMHFQYGGHQILENEIAKNIENLTQ